MLTPFQFESVAAKKPEFILPVLLDQHGFLVVLLHLRAQTQICINSFNKSDLAQTSACRAAAGLGSFYRIR